MSPDDGAQERQVFYADAGDEGFRFILPSTTSSTEGGLARPRGFGHLCTIVGRGGTGKSILALQLVTWLLKQRNKETGLAAAKPNAAFYFTLEASPAELVTQVLQFRWGRESYQEHWGAFDPKKRSKKEGARCEGPDDRYSNGLYIVRIPSPAQDLNAVNRQVRQTIARQLPTIRGLVAIVIDPMGGIILGDDLRSELSQLKQLSDSHRKFLFLLVEDHIFERHTSIEHYSQSIIHLKHDPKKQPFRRLYIQKARGQSFRSGYHHFELRRPGRDENGAHGSSTPKDDGATDAQDGVRVVPSLQAQSAETHEELTPPSGAGAFPICSR